MKRIHVLRAGCLAAVLVLMTLAPGYASEAAPAAAGAPERAESLLARWSDLWQSVRALAGPVDAPADPGAPSADGSPSEGSPNQAGGAGEGDVGADIDPDG